MASKSKQPSRVVDTVDDADLRAIDFVENKRCAEVAADDAVMAGFSEVQRQLAKQAMTENRSFRWWLQKCREASS